MNASVSPTIEHDGGERPPAAARAGLRRLCHRSSDPVAVFSVPEGTLLEANRGFRDLISLPESIPPNLTVACLEAPELGHMLREWEGAEPRLIREMSLDGISGRGRLLPIPGAVPIQVILQFTPNRGGSRVDPQRQKDLEDRLQQLGNFERLRVLGETAAIIVHELRVPLSSIHLGVESVRHSSTLHPSLRSRLDVALEQLGRMDRLLSSIRSFSRPRALEIRPMEIRATFSAALAAVEASLRGPRTTVALEVRPDPLWIVADPEALA